MARPKHTPEQAAEAREKHRVKRKATKDHRAGVDLALRRCSACHRSLELVRQAVSIARGMATECLSCSDRPSRGDRRGVAPRRCPRCGVSGHFVVRCPAPWTWTELAQWIDGAPSSEAEAARRLAEIVAERRGL